MRNHFRRDANCSAEAYDGKPAVRNHAAHRARAHLPQLSELIDSQQLFEPLSVIGPGVDPLLRIQPFVIDPLHVHLA
jgi:hypothetical protein